MKKRHTGRPTTFKTCNWEVSGSFTLKSCKTKGKEMYKKVMHVQSCFLIIRPIAFFLFSFASVLPPWLNLYIKFCIIRSSSKSTHIILAFHKVCLFLYDAKPVLNLSTKTHILTSFKYVVKVGFNFLQSIARYTNTHTCAKLEAH